MSPKRRVKITKTANDVILGVTITIGVEELFFLDPNSSWITVETKPTQNGVHLLIEGGEGVAP